MCVCLRPTPAAHRAPVPTPLPPALPPSLPQELILFSRADLDRSIPSMLDGLKPGQRKILYACFKRNLKKDIKVRPPPGSCPPRESCLPSSPLSTHTHLRCRKRSSCLSRRRHCHLTLR